MSQWISVKDRLPEESGNYIVTACDEGCPYGEGIWYSTVVVCAEYYEGDWIWCEGVKNILLKESLHTGCRFQNLQKQNKPRAFEP